MIDVVGFAIGCVLLVLGAGIALRPRRARLEKEATVANRTAQIDAGAEERYFEERRSLQAYPPPATDSRMRMAGYLTVVFGLWFVATSLWSLLQ